MHRSLILVALEVAEVRRSSHGFRGSLLGRVRGAFGIATHAAFPDGTTTNWLILAEPVRDQPERSPSPPGSKGPGVEPVSTSLYGEGAERKMRHREKTFPLDGRIDHCATPHHASRQTARQTATLITASAQTLTARDPFISLIRDGRFSQVDLIEP